MKSERRACGEEPARAIRCAPLRFFRRHGWKLLGAALLVWLALAPFAAAQKGGEEGKGKVQLRRGADSADLIRRRAAWFYNQRAFPLGFIPAGARLRALQQMERMISQQKAQSFPSEIAAPAGAAGITTPTWTQIGPQPTNSPFFQPFTSGRVNALAVDPLDSTGNTAYLGAAQGGVWKTTNGGTAWTPLTDSQPSLAVGSIALGPPTPPNTSSTIYVGTGEENFAFDSYYGAGVLKSVDGGLTWTQDTTFTATTPINQFSRGPRIGALAVDPVNSQILLATVQGSGSTLVSGIYCSQDGGNSWVHVLPAAGILRIVGTDVVFDKDGTAYAALGNIDGSGGLNGVYKSAQPVTACTTPTGGVAITWNQLPLPAPSSSMGRIALGIGPPVTGSTKGELFAAIADASNFSSDLFGVFRSTDGGMTWTQLSSSSFVTSAGGFCNHQCFYDLVIRVSPTNPSLVFAGGAARNATLIRSTDGGVSWSEVSNNRTTNFGLHVDMHALAFLPPIPTNSNPAPILYVGNDGGVWSTNNPAGAITWTNLNAPLAITQFYPGFSFHPSNPAFRSFGGTQDNGLERFSGGILGNPFQWDDTGTLGDGGFTAFDPQVPSTVYASSEFVPGFLALIKSFRNGDGIAATSTFFVAENGININDNGNFIPPFVIDPSTPQRLYFGTFRVWQTTDGANSWNAISPDLTGGTGCSSTVGGVLTTIAVAPSNSSTIYTGSCNGHVNVSMNVGPGSATWTDISTGLPTRAVTSVAADPRDGTGKTAYVTFSGFSGFITGDTQGHVFMTTTGGTAWGDISGLSGTSPLPNIPVNDIVIDPVLANTLYVATDIGVFMTSNPNPGTTTWSVLGSGLPKVAVLSLKLDPATRTLYAATHGRSVWSLPLGSLPTFSLGTINPASDNASDANNLTLTVTGTGFTGGSVVQFNGANLATTFDSMQQLTATIPSTDLAGSSVALVDVTDPAQTALTNSLRFTVVAKVPTVMSISPTSTTAPAGADVPLTINGTNFLANSTVQLVQLAPVSPSVVVNSVNSTGTQLAATIPQAALQFGGTFVVNVTNPQPGGGPSCPSLDPTVCSSAVLVATAAPPLNDNIANATVVGSSTYTNTVDSSGATIESTDPLPPCVQGIPAPFAPAANGHARSVWYKATAGANGTIEADTIGSAYDTILSVWSGTATSLTPVACNDDIVLGIDRVSQLSFSASSGTTYFFMVSAFSGDGGKTVFNLSGNVVPTPNYTTGASPNTATVKAGQSTSPITVTLTPQAGSVNGTVTLSCSGLPSKSSCNFSPSNTVNLSSSPVMVTLTISTTASTAVFPLPPGPTTRLPASAPWLGLAAIALLFFLWTKRPSPRTKLAFGFACAFLLLAVLVFQVSCGGGGSSTPTPIPGTPPGTYTVTINGSPASSGGQSPPTVSLTVTP